MLCLKCLKLSALGSNLCPYCGGSFGGTRCSQNHLSPGLGKLTYCATCRSTELVDAVPSIRLRALSRIVAWSLALCVVHLGLVNLSSLLAALGSLVAWTVGPNLMGLLWNLLAIAFVLKIFAWFVRLFNPGAAKSLEVCDRFLPELAKVLAKLSLFLLKTLLWLAEGKSVKPARDKKAERTTIEGADRLEANQ